MDYAGFVLARPGSTTHFIGPCIADSVDTARDLITRVIAEQSDKDLFWDLLHEIQQAVVLARCLCFEPAHRLTRMACPAGTSLPGDQPLIWATAGFESG